jgi:hypothetical protein
MARIAVLGFFKLPLSLTILGALLPLPLLPLLLLPLLLIYFAVPGPIQRQNGKKKPLKISRQKGGEEC